MQNLAKEMLAEMLTEAAWNELSENYPWTEQLLERQQSKVNWELISENNEIIWTPSMLEKFKQLIDWKKLSSTGCKTILTEACIEQFRDNWDWEKLSYYAEIRFDYQLIDKFIDMWDWERLINRYDIDHLYTYEFIDRYAHKIPLSQLKDSKLFEVLQENEIPKYKLEILCELDAAK